MGHTPKYRLHKGSGQALVEIGGARYYLGVFDSPASREKYHRLLAESVATEGAPKLVPADPRTEVTVGILILSYWSYVKKRYVKNGEPTTEQRLILTALNPVLTLYQSLFAKDFGPLCLIACRGKLVAAGICRKKVNEHLGRIRRCWQWGVSRELVPVATWQALQSVEGLRKGEGAPETEPVRPVTLRQLLAVRRELSPVLWEMVAFQFRTGARPGETCNLRPCDVDRRGAVWKYTPSTHKTEHHDRVRIVFIGPKALSRLKPWLRGRAPDGAAFSPRESKEWYLARRRANRRTPMTPSQRDRKRKAKPRRSPRDQFTPDNYAAAIRNACQRAKLPREEWWAPNQLRHAAATRIRADGDLESSRVVLGHSSAVTSEIYAEADLKKAADVMRRLG